MNPNIEDATTTIEPITQPKPEKYINCECCQAILGYVAHDQGVLWFYLYACAPHGVRPNLPERRVNARILNGDVHCPHCGQWMPWTAASNFPFIAKTT